MGGAVLFRILFPPQGRMARGFERRSQSRYPAPLQRSARIFVRQQRPQEVREGTEGSLRGASRCGGRRIVSEVQLTSASAVRRVDLKTKLMTVFVVSTNVLGNFAMSWGMKHQSVD